jgi:Asp-tRNA(Asn)/Glu-tRNA(Gln) amidotransferase A subunit family amidase
VAGLVPIALGADGGGSIRIPSSYCGIWGLKPTHGRVSASPTPGLANTVCVYGPMATSIDDLALAYRIMATPAPTAEDSQSASFPNPLASIPSTSAIAARRKVIGLVRPWIDRAEPSVRVVFDAALRHYQHQQGYSVIDIDIPYLPEGHRAHSLTILSEISSGVGRSQIRDLTPHNKLLLSVTGNMATAQDFLASQKMRHLLMCHLAHLFTQYPGLVIFTPTCPIPGSKIECGAADLTHGVADGKASVRSMEYTWLANFTGCPAISCPAGYNPDSGVPIGLMGMSEWGTEEALFHFARDGEAVLDSNTVTTENPSANDTGKGLRTPSGDGSEWVDLISTCR